MVNGGLKWYSKVLETNIICPKTTTFVNEMFYPLEFKSRLAHQKKSHPNRDGFFLLVQLCLPWRVSEVACGSEVTA